jgi:uncharacterized protein YjeT (DUF2065 family)
MRKVIVSGQTGELTMQLLVEQFVAISLLIVGLSHLLYPALWVHLHADLFSRPYAALVIGTLTLPVGLLVVLAHNVWAPGLPLIVTLFGWACAAKGVAYLLRPRVPVPFTADSRWARRGFVAVGACTAVAGAVLTWRAFVPGAV